MVYKFYDDYKKIIVRLRMWYADIRGHHGKRWDYEPGDWVLGHGLQKNKNKERKINMEKAKTKKYMVMSKFNHSDRFNLEKQFVNRHSADAYVELMIEDKEYADIEYFLFEQSHDYQYKDEGYDIKSELISSRNRFNEKVSFSKYTLNETN